MTQLKSWWSRMSFWNKVERSFGLIGAVAVTEMGINEVHYGWFIAIGICGLVGKLILIWFEDINKDGIADIFQ